LQDGALLRAHFRDPALGVTQHRAGRDVAEVVLDACFYIFGVDVARDDYDGVAAP